ncbi:o-succinylbenzoate synthase [Aneurinibacillus sp. Ricciae_BoGa-3]|uniref:o-succinylbenzoate synthase n=1 Tax=Aneurinibacillus sp. Ricciae_BoGa-3 TaxID=3022697 RepID=UPI002341E0E4|nr:o-succinylbenzoate synthase [Aneurinibacillus sp. Ricciae_BoGa-3]WCK56585.1 o-succinylbenzoate synthase [Aneurinibacillus sp. Ricciae_BoGa-3]
MKVEKIVLRRMKMKLKSPFQTSFSTQYDRDFIIIEVHTAYHVGFGECVVSWAPYYNEETVITAWHMLEDFLIPLVLNKEITHPGQVDEIFSPIRRNNMAKAGLEGAFWDLYAKQSGQSLAQALGGTKDKIEVGVSIGIQEDMESLFQLVEQYLGQGYRRMKIKIKPGHDVEVLFALRKRFGNVPMMADANSAYSLEDMDVFTKLDELGLMMIEQPLGYDDIIDHAKLQAKIKTPICLDESIHSCEDARKAIEMGSTRVINIKIGRVGGLSEAKRIHDLCQQHNVPVWCGGMLESGIGRAHNIALTSLPNFLLPGDTSGSSRYWEEDVVDPEVTVSANGTIEVPKGPGIGYTPVAERLKKYTTAEKVFTVK